MSVHLKGSDNIKSWLIEQQIKRCGVPPRGGVRLSNTFEIKAWLKSVQTNIIVELILKKIPPTVKRLNIDEIRAWLRHQVDQGTMIVSESRNYYCYYFSIKYPQFQNGQHWSDPRVRNKGHLHWTNSEGKHYGGICILNLLVQAQAQAQALYT
jgi:hypothetical protein